MWHFYFWRSFCYKICSDEYKTHQILDEAADDCLAALKYVPDWFVTSTMIKKLLTDKQMMTFCFNEYCYDATFCFNEMGILDINLDDTNYDEDDPETIIHIRFLAWHVKFEKRKAKIVNLNKS